ncbi:MAG: dehydrogenase [Cyclobacteriaceae bacterium]|nr:MAG: dehydrogenase [Cyclobacteriaceae bacterium]
MLKTSNSGRRAFLKKGGAAIGSTVLASLPGSISAHVSGSDQIRVGLIGCGNRGAGAAVQALAATKSAKLVAMGDTFRDRLDKSYHAILENVDKAQVDVPETNKFVGFDAYKKVIELSDAVLLVTPPPFRPIHFDAAVRADKHVFMEKPLAVDVPGYHKIMETSKLADQKKLTVVVGLQNRYKKSYELLFDQIRGGTIGDIASLSVYYCVGAPVIHARKPGQTEMEYQMRNWRYFTWLWGGQLAGQSIHPIDAINWLMQDYPIVAKGLGGRQVFSGPDQGNTFDHHFVEFEYPNGIKLNVQSQNINNAWRGIGWDIKCTSGTADEKSRIYDSHRDVIWRHDDRDDPNPYQVEHDVFFDAIINNNPRNDTEWGAKSTLTTIMGRMAMHSGQIMKLDEVLQSRRSIVPDQFTWDAVMPDMPDESGNYVIPMPGSTQVL